MTVTNFDQLDAIVGRIPVFAESPTTLATYYGTGNVGGTDQWRGGEAYYNSADDKIYIQTATSGTTPTWVSLGTAFGTSTTSSTTSSSTSTSSSSSSSSSTSSSSSSTSSSTSSSSSSSTTTSSSSSSSSSSTSTSSSSTTTAP